MKNWYSAVPLACQEESFEKRLAVKDKTSKRRSDDVAVIMALKALRTRLWWANKQTKKQQLMEGCGEAICSLRKHITSAVTFEVCEVVAVYNVVGIKKPNVDYKGAN